MKNNIFILPIGGESIEKLSLNITENGSYSAAEGTAYTEVSVSVPDIPAVTEPLSVTENGTYTAPEGVDGFSEVTVNVPDIPAVTEPLNVTENGTYTTPEGVDGFSEVTVEVPETVLSVVSSVESVTVLGYTSLQANIYVASNQTITSCGVEVSTTIDFAEFTTLTAVGNSNGTKRVYIGELTPGTTYYIRSYVIVNDVNYNQEPYNTSTTAMTPAVPENIPATATKMVTANTDVVNLKFKNNSPDEVVYIDWGDGADNGSIIDSSTSLGSTPVSHTYSEAGVYDVYIWSESSTDTTYGKMPAFEADGTDMKIARIETPLQNIYNKSNKITANTTYALQNAFSGCKSLEYVCPTLLENVHYYNSNGICTVNTNGYRNMFSNCTSLTSAPELPATSTSGEAYFSMFYNCKSLITAPELPATSFGWNAYANMFNGCTNLQSVTTYCVNWNISYTPSWLSGAGTNAENPTIYCPADSKLKNHTNTIDGIPSGWTQVDLPTE